MRARIFASLMLLIAAANASGHMYKYVGPDGKITYSDHPPIEPTANVKVLSAGVIRPVAAGERGYLAPAAPDAPAMPASVQPEQPKGPDLAPVLPALRAALSETLLIDRTVDLCILALPRAYQRYVSAQDAWKQRNGAVTEHVADLMNDVVPGQERQQLEQEALEHTAASLKDVRATSLAQRIAWCDKTANDIKEGRFDLASIPGLPELMKFQAR
jgi:hypothetical protein